MNGKVQLNGNWTSEQSLTIDQIHAMFLGILSAAEARGGRNEAARVAGRSAHAVAGARVEREDALLREEEMQ